MKALTLFIASLAISLPLCLSAQNDTTIIVPFDPSDPSLPHPSYEGTTVSLKAIIRNPQCAQYRVVWDLNRNGFFGDDPVLFYTRNGQTNSVRYISSLYEIPNVSRDTLITIGVEVTNTCNNRRTTAEMQFFVHDFKPDLNPENWTDKQVEVMSAVANSEAMWYVHKSLSGLTNIKNRPELIRGNLQYAVGSVSALKLLLRNGHLPAYQPNTLNTASLNISQSFINENDERWWRDPYAETSMRLMNWVLSSNFATVNITPISEDSTMGYDTNGNPIQTTRIAGTNDSRGFVFNIGR